MWSYKSKGHLWGLKFGLSCVPSSLTSICPLLLRTELLPLTLMLLPSRWLQWAVRLPAQPLPSQAGPIKLHFSNCFGGSSLNSLQLVYK